MSEGPQFGVGVLANKAGMNHRSKAGRGFLAALLGSCCVLVAGAAGTAEAATALGNLAARVVVQATCAVTSPGLNFGPRISLAANINVNARITVTCTNTIPYAVGLGAGLYGGSVTTRKMQYALGAQTINYAIYRNAARTLNWGNTVGADTVAGTGSGAAQNLTARGRIPGPQVIPHAGGYADTVQITVTY